MRKSNNKENQHYQNMRSGDWICFNCNNLNFSFRDICNRCKVQSKEYNNSYYQFFISLPSIDIISSSPMPNQKTSQKQNQNHNWIQNQQNKVFESAVLLTPTKQNNENTNSQNDEPYKSPEQLPSIPPILKSYNRRALWQQLTNQTKMKSISKTAIPLKNSNVKQITITSFISIKQCNNNIKSQNEKEEQEQEQEQEEEEHDSNEIDQIMKDNIEFLFN